MKINNPELYSKNGYMQGRCANCKEWEAPITQEELDRMPDIYAYHGSGVKEIDSNVFYRREVWLNYFQCPNCKHRFSVKFSST